VTNTEYSALASNDSQSYGRAAIVFHWAVALLLVWVGVLGLLHDSWPKRSHSFWINIHAVSGLALWILVIARVCWRVSHAPPSLPADIRAPYRHLSRTAHWALYALLFVTPMIGIVTFIWHGRTFDFGLFQVNPGIARNRAVFEPTEDVHGYLAYALFAVAGAHILAALWHHFVRRDGVLRRMWPSTGS
jgi:cytochrome b561